MGKYVPGGDFFNDPLEAMVEQSNWALGCWVERAGTPEGERFREIFLHQESEIQVYVKENNYSQTLLESFRRARKES